MPKYATTQTFAGQRASVGRIVVAGSSNGPCAGIISSIGDDDQVRLVAADIVLVAPYHGATRRLDFKDCRTESDVNALSEYEWTWPVRV